MQAPAEVPHQIADAHLPAAAAVCDAATALDTAMDMVDPQPTLVELLVRHVLLPREFLPQSEINSTQLGRCCVVWLRPHVERLVPVQATNLAFDPTDISPSPLSLG